MSVFEVIASWVGTIILCAVAVTLVVGLVVACVLMVDWTVRELRRRARTK